MDYLDFGDNIDYNKYNALVYLLRKFKKLTSNLTLGAYKLESDYGTFNFSDGFVNVGNNWILENPVTVTSNDVLKNTFYTFNFVVIDVNTTGTVNRRIVSVTEGTGETGTLELTIPSDLIGTDEVILPNFTLEVVFDEHEYYTQLPDVHLSLSVDKMGIRAGEVATITGLLTDSTSTPIENVSLPLNVDGTTVTVITDSTGEFNYAYTGTGTRGKVFVSALGESVYFYDGLINILAAIVTGNNVSLGGYNPWLITTGDVVIYWGDGTSDTVNNPRGILSHTYADGLNEHLIIFEGTVTSLGPHCFYNCSGLTSVVIPDSVTIIGDMCFAGCTGLTSVVIPDSVTSIGGRCFYGCSGLTSVVIPDSVTSLRDLCFEECSGLTSVVIPNSVTNIGNYCFNGCTGLTTYDLYWESNPVAYDSNKMRINTNTVFNIPYGKTQLYVDANYPVARLVERGSHNYQLSVVSDKDIISRTEVATLTATLSDNSTPVSGETLNYQIKHGSTVIDSGTKTTDSNGEATITYTGSGVGDVDIVVSYGTLLQETFVIQDCYLYDDTLTDKSSNYSKTNYLTVTHNTDYYSLAPSRDNQFLSLTNGYDNIEASVKIQPSASNALNGLTVSDRQDSYYNNVSLELSTNRFIFFTMDNGSFNSRNEVTRALGSNWYTVVLKVEGSNVTYTVYDSSDNQIYTYSYTKSISNKYVNVALSTMNNLNIKDIKIKAL